MVKKFDSYMLEKGLQVNGISFHMRTLRALYNKAVKEGVASKDNYPFEKYKIKREKTVHRALTKEEVKRNRRVGRVFHSCYNNVARHSLASIAKRGGISTTVISEGLGHATEHITQVYLAGFENSVLDDADNLITNLD